MSPSSKATNLLDKLLASSATRHRRLDSLTNPAPPSSRTTRVQGDPGVRKPGAILDSCLCRAQELNDKVDRVSTKLKTPAVLMGAADSKPPKANQVHVQQQTKGNTAIGCTSTNEVQREERPMDQSPGCRAPVITHSEVVKNSATLSG